MKKRIIQAAWKLFGAKKDEILRNPKKMDDLVLQAKNKLSQNDGVLGNIKNEFVLLFQLILAYSKGEYREISLKSMGLVVFAVMYFVIPTDIIPDFLIGIGFFDDTAVILWAIRSIRKEIEKFRAWSHEKTL